MSLRWLLLGCALAVPGIALADRMVPAGRPLPGAKVPAPPGFGPGAGSPGPPRRTRPGPRSSRYWTTTRADCPGRSTRART